MEDSVKQLSRGRLKISLSLNWQQFLELSFVHLKNNCVCVCGGGCCIECAYLVVVLIEFRSVRATTCIDNLHMVRSTQIQQLPKSSQFLVLNMANRGVNVANRGVNMANGV